MYFDLFFSYSSLLHLFTLSHVSIYQHLLEGFIKCTSIEKRIQV